MTKRQERAIAEIKESLRVKQALIDRAGILVEIADQIALALVKGNKVVLFGNGGSAADAEHLATELAGRFMKDRAPLAAVALNSSTTALTAIANDYGYENVFSRQVSGLVKTGDVVVGISTSGNSKNVIAGLEEAKRKHAVTVAFTGSGGKLREIAQYVLDVPSRQTPRIQECHITAGHIVCSLVEEALFGGGRAKR